MLLLWKLRREKMHRRRTASTHDDLDTSTTSWLRYEALLDTFLHKNSRRSAFKNHPPQIALSWDPSSYGGKDILVVMGCSKELQKRFYCLSQWLSKMKLSDSDGSLVKF